MTIGEQIKNQRSKIGLTQRELAQKLHIAASTLCQYENGSRVPSDDVKNAIANFFGVSIDFLLGRHEASSANAISVPVLGTIPAGIAVEAIQDIIDWEELPAAMAAGGKEYFGLIIKGDSMYPALFDGDVVIIRKQPCCDSGDICAVYVNGFDATLKHVFFGEDGSITLKPKNPEYAPRTYTAQEIADLPVSIAGVVVELRRKMR